MLAIQNMFISEIDNKLPEESRSFDTKKGSYRSNLKVPRNIFEINSEQNNLYHLIAYFFTNPSHIYMLM